MSNILNQIKLSGITYDLQDASAIHSLEGYWTSGQTESAITAATNALAEAVAEELSAKTDVSAFTAYTSSTETTLSGKLDTSVFETYSGNVDTALASKIAGAAWDSTTSHLNFYDNVSATGTILTYVDGADWVKDSFLKSVTVEDKQISGETVTCLVFVFETESGETETDIPLTDIFDPSNYYTTAQTDSAIAAAVSGKADSSAVTEEISAAVSGKVDTTTFNTYSGSVETALSGKQETLVSGTNIKTINGSSILGSGDLTVDTGLHASVSGTTLIFE